MTKLEMREKQKRQETANQYKANNVDLHIAIRLQMRRKMMGLSQIDVAKRCNVSYQQIQK